MSFRIATSSLRVAARPCVLASASSILARYMASSSNSPSPEERAKEIVNKLPSSPGLITKTGTALLATSLTAAAISNELYVVNEESIIAIGSLIFAYFAGKAIKGPYVEWAQTNVDKIKNVLDSARADHTQSVQERIDAVSQMKDVSVVTQAMFAVAKETATMESETFIQKQKVALASEVKAVLDSWVRYEQQQKENEQAELTKAVISKVLSTLNDEKTQKEILISAVAEIEQMVKTKAI